MIQSTFSWKIQFEKASNDRDWLAANSGSFLEEAALALSHGSSRPFGEQHESGDISRHLLLSCKKFSLVQLSSLLSAVCTPANS